MGGEGIAQERRGQDSGSAFPVVYARRNSSTSAPPSQESVCALTLHGGRWRTMKWPQNKGEELA